MESSGEPNVAPPPPIDVGWHLGVGDQWLIMWALLIAGVVLFLSAGLIGQWRTTQWDTHHYGWSPDGAAQIAWNISAFAAMTFLAGLTERIALEIALLRRELKR